MKKTKVTLVLCLLAYCIQVVSELLLFISIWKLNMIPDKYMVLLAAGLTLMLVLTASVMFFRGKHPVSCARRWVAVALALVITTACIFGMHAVSGFRSTIDNVITQEPSGVPVAVFVETGDAAQVLTDAKSYTFGVVSGYETARTNYAVDEIEKQLQCNIETVEFPSVFDMVDGLLAKGIGAMILNPAYTDVLEEIEGYTDFSEKTRILCEVMTPEQLVAEIPEETTVTAATETVEETTEPVVLDITEKTFTVYLSGTDTRAKVFRTCRSDVNIIAVVNPVSHQILLLNTPRDYYVPNPAGNNKPDKLTHCGMYGVENSVRTLTNLYNINIDYYARINFSGFEKLIDAIGGITVYSDKSFKAVHELTVNKGYNSFNGKEALLFARERYHVSGGDNGRGKNQMKVISAVINKLSTSTALISNYSGILNSLGDMFTMSIASQDVSLLVKMQLEEMPEWEVFSFAVTGVCGRNVTYSMPGSKLSVMYIDDAYVSHASSLVNRMMAGERIEDADLKMNIE